jgi:hypothetical protein
MMTDHPENTHPDNSQHEDPRDDNWASNRDHLEVGQVPAGASASRVQGRRLTGPQQGFGQMWQKTYRVAIPGKTPQQVISTWKAEYGRFWPDNTRFYAPLTGIKPGEIGLIKSTQGGLPLSTGVLVLYSDDVSFSYMTPEGHPFAGFITFSADDQGGTTMAQAQLLIRSNDPLYEAGMILFGSRAEDKMWQHTLQSLADYLGSSAPVETKIVRVDKKRQWKNFRNVRYNGLLPRRRNRQALGG